ncbi:MULTISPECIES: ATP-dependent DNA helicase [unclassified Variovorax]|jgi:DNA excision repair protein ERCC-2|uniref:ATP-dependent DNA helicase n=1 Tax=unclassified Variovorax TaxID=663243 RepID=UPI000F7E1871|nr:MULTISPECIES: ATP-dependent DNA helicase [unclassified Variovorax]RSZ37201.1 ATP-dependent DNA helicase [Variovorax sp. 553]RSZ38015.1 ATP-dependent DNA helicase [Variovorax sp. 679]
MGSELSRPQDAAPVVAEQAVSVKALCAFGAKAGDLDLRFVPAPSALEGMAGHAMVQHRRDPEHYACEVGLEATCGALRVRGRADGYEARRARVEEIKTFRGDFDAIRGNHRALHWAQARTYGWMLCELDGHDEMTVALVYLDLATGDETVLEEQHTREALKEHFELLCGRYSEWARGEAAHCEALGVTLAGLEFPHRAFRAGQRELAEAVYRAALNGRCLMAQAPTGIGKTLATIFPLLKARAARRIDKLFFLTAKTSGRPVALDALRVLDRGQGESRLRVLELAAREKVCEYPDRACHGDACPLARGFYDRLPAAREQAAQVAWLDREALRNIALAHEVCPYFLAQEMAHWADAIVGDYNYYFDGSAFLYATMRDAGWRVAVLVDEAHNLLERSRGMYTAQLEGEALEEAHRAAPAVLCGPLARLFREWDTVQQSQVADYETADEIPERFLRTLQATNTAMAEYFAATPDASQGPLQRFFFDALHFARLAEAFGDHSVFERTLGAAQQDRTLAIRNLVPAPFLESRFGDAVSVTCFSGTLSPFGFYRDALGLPEDTALLDVASPFDSAQLRVEVATHVSTRFRDRAGSLRDVADIIGAQFERLPGNYLAFFSSFDYLEKASAAFSMRHPGVPVWTQTRGMREADRHGFIARFEEGGQGVGFAVLGGAFGEGIDLPGSRLIGAFVASLGLPQYNELNEITRERMQARFGKGYEYTYLYPGLQKVVQAAGRVIRTEEDRGVLHLLDDRFARAEIRELLPRWWHVRSGGDEEEAPRWP